MNLSHTEENSNPDYSPCSSAPLLDWWCHRIATPANVNHSRLPHRTVALTSLIIVARQSSSFASLIKDRCLVDQPGFVHHDDYQLSYASHRYRIVRHSFSDSALFVINSEGISLPHPFELHFALPNGYGASRKSTMRRRCDSHGKVTSR
eukprot:scaffold9748_cov111-Cylindrotheca_fusiformis.AAC.3